MSALFAGIGIFQDVTMRLIAERVLHDADGSTYVDGELISRKLKALPPPSDSHKFHICCSALNPGALALVHELAEKRGFDRLTILVFRIPYYFDA